MKDGPALPQRLISLTVQTLARSFPPAGIAPSFSHFHPEMEAMDETPDDTLPVSANSSGRDVAGYRPRGYQLEMLEASQQQNIIVAVGSSVRGA